jgi:hypothetical protein
LENLLRRLGEGKMLLRQMVSSEPIHNTMVVVEPKAKKNYKTKNEKEK